MAQSSQDILNQINQQYGNIGSAANTIESTIKNAYAPSIKALVEEGNTLRGQYYPAFFNEAQRLGTGAADMSPAARLAAMQQAGENMGQLYRTNLGLRDFFNTDINNLVGRAQNQYMNAYNALKDQYTMALQGEQARAAAGAANNNAKLLQDLINAINTGGGGGSASDNIAINVPDSVLPGNVPDLKQMILDQLNPPLLNYSPVTGISQGQTPVGYNTGIQGGTFTTPNLLGNLAKQFGIGSSY